MDIHVIFVPLRVSFKIFAKTKGKGVLSFCWVTELVGWKPEASGGPPLPPHKEGVCLKMKLAQEEAELKDGERTF